MQEWWVRFCSSFIPVKCLSWWWTDYMPMLMTPHYWQLFTSQHTDLLLLPPLTGSWLGFRSGAIAGASYCTNEIHNCELSSWWLGPVWGFHLRWSQPRYSWREVNLTAGSLSETMYQLLSLVSLQELVFWGWWSVSSWTPICCFVGTMHLFSQSLSIVLRCEGQLLNVLFSFSISSNSCIRWTGFAMIRVSCRCVIDVMVLHSVCCTKLIRTRIIVCALSFHLLLSEFDIPSCGSVYIVIRKVSPAGPDSCAEWPSLHCVWHRNVRWV